MIIKENIDEIQAYFKDASGYQGSLYKVYVPSNYKELKQIISELFSTKTCFTISGAGTGLAGGRTPDKGVLISLENLNRIVDIDPHKRTVIVEPGTLLSDLQNELSKNRVFLPQNPTESNSSIGGNISTNASGSRSFKYGPYRNIVIGLKIILANGEELLLRRGQYISKNNELSIISSEGMPYNIPVSDIGMPAVKHNAGYYLKDEMDAIDLFIGSEGTLGVVAEATLKIETTPENVLGLNIFFDSEDAMLEFINVTRSLSKLNNQFNYKVVTEISARLIEMFDRNALDLIREDSPQIPISTNGCVWIEQEYAKVNEDELLNNWNEHISKFTNIDNTWIALTPPEHEKLRHFRHLIPLKVNDIMSGRNLRKVGTDTAVPDKYFKEFYQYVVGLLNESGIKYAIWGHAGDSHLHANLLPENRIEFDKSLEIINLIIAKSLKSGGTVSAEHGIGKIKKQYLLEMFGQENIDKMKKIKQILDRENLLGRGNLFD